jgi:hypothetical protein
VPVVALVVVPVLVPVLVLAVVVVLRLDRMVLLHLHQIVVKVAKWEEEAQQVHMVLELVLE